VYYVLFSQIIESESYFADIELDPSLVKPDVMLYVITEVTAQEQVNDHKHILLILKGEPKIDEERVIQTPQQLHLLENISDGSLLDAHIFVHVLHGIHLLSITLLNNTHLEEICILC